MIELNHKVKKKIRIIVRKGIENIALRTEDILLIYTENKIIFVLDANNNKYLCDKSLTELEQDLDPSLFFRANRQYIVNLKYIKGFKSFQRVKLQVDLTLATRHEIIVSQDTAPDFRKWARSVIKD